MVSLFEYAFRVFTRLECHYDEVGDHVFALPGSEDEAGGP